METFEYFLFIERNNEKENEKDHGNGSKRFKSSLHFLHSRNILHIQLKLSQQRA